MFAYENQVETARRAFDIFRKLAETADKDKESDPVASMMPFARPEKTMKEWLDFSLLPPFDKVAKYFHMNVGTASAGADGISLKYFAPTPPQLKK